MKRLSLTLALFPLLAVFGIGARGQSSLDLLQKDLDELKAQRQESASKNLDYFLASLQTAAASPDAADKLYLAAGGTPPPAARVITKYDHETPSEQDARQALDQAILAGFDGNLELQCGLMRFAALFITQPKLATLQDDWLAWLKNSAQLYPQVMVGVTDSRVGAAGNQNFRERRNDRRNQDGAGAPAKMEVGGGIRDMAVSASPIGGYLGFKGWGDAKQAQWRVADLPGLYKDQVLEPLRKKPTAATLAAWDVYIAMMNADQPDSDKWNNIDAPALQFDKAADDFTGAPGTDKLENLIAFIKAHPDHPQLDSWIGRVHDMVEVLKGHRAAQDAANSASAENTLPPIQPDSPPPPAVSVPAP